MKCFDLMPEPRRQAKACRARIHQWLVVGVAYVVMLVTICVVCHRTWGIGPDPLTKEISQTTDSIRKYGKTIVVLQKQLVSSRWKLDTFKGVGQQPDWSVVLTLLADGLGNEVVLSGCELDEIRIPLDSDASGNQQPTSGALEDKKQKMAFVLSVSGFGRSQTAVSQFVLRMERSGLFDNVRLVSTVREPFLNAKAVAFRLKCRFEGSTNR
ncbi:MAG: PilN domain-containing protein [bacterium]|nr:PilN domain-containing protein [bacterium]